MSDWTGMRGMRRNHITRARADRINLIAEDICPECRGELDTGWQCNDCGFDCQPEIANVKLLDRKGPQDGESIS
jgi:hypothetical protein